MTLMKWENDLNRLPGLFDSVWGSDLLDMASRLGNEGVNNTLPAVNIYETNEDYKVEVAAPGYSKKDFNITLDNDLLTISSEKENPEGQQGDFTRREFNYQSFKRSFTLPNTVEEEKISANYKNGILHISIPKKEEAKTKPPRQIEIK